MNRAMIRRLAAHSLLRVSGKHNYKEPTNSMQLALNLSWRAPLLAAGQVMIIEIKNLNI